MTGPRERAQAVPAVLPAHAAAVSCGASHLDVLPPGAAVGVRARARGRLPG